MKRAIRNNSLKLSIKGHEMARSALSRIDYAAWLMLDSSRLSKKKHKEVKKLLVVLYNGKDGNIGGDYCTLGVLNSLKKNNPKVDISLMCDPRTIKQFGTLKHINTIELTKKEDIENLKGKGFDAVVFMNFGPFSVKDFYFIPLRVHWTASSIGRFKNRRNRFFFTQKMYLPWGMHMIDLRYGLLELLGFSFKEKKPFVEFTQKERNKVKTLLKKHKVKKCIVIHPGGKHVVPGFKKGQTPPHLWPLDRYREVAEYFTKKGYHVFISGSPDEEILAKEIKGNNKKVISTCGSLSFREAGALLEKTNVLIATDTSIVHIAYQVGTPIVELMGPSVPEVVAAWPLKSKKHIVLIDDGPCARSMRKIAAPKGIICLGKITVAQVINATEKLLARF